jgi:phage I-like protein
VPRAFTKLAIEFANDALPNRFRLFVSGWNETENGNFLFDEAAAAAVMAAYRSWGVDLAIDLEHQMLSPGIAPDPTAKDARGWCQLELAADGSLWAINVRWTPDGAARLAEKRQRYISPAFEIEPETKRVTKIVNVAITAIPATHNTPALVAASLQRLSMDPKLVQQALDALIEGDTEKCAELLKGAIAAAASTPEAEAPAAEPAPEASAAPAPEAEEAAAAPPAAPSAEGEEEKDEEEEKAAVVAASKLVRLSGKASLADALEEIAAWKTSHIELETKRQELAREKAALESAERVRLAKDLVQIGAEFPSTVWTDEKSTALKPRWLKMDIAELRSHVADQKAARASKKTPTAPKSPAESGKEFATPHGPITLSARELKFCADEKADPQVYANNKAFQIQARGGR